MNRKKIHKIIIKLITGICLVIYFTTSGIIKINTVKAFSSNISPIEYKISNTNIKLSTIKKNNTLTQYGEKNMLTGKVGGEYKIHGWYQNRLNNLARGYNKELNIYSGYRSYELQKQLFDNSDRTGRTVAHAGKSRHQVGLAVDVDSKWVKELNNTQLAKYGLYKPMSYEDWHIEPIETKGKSTQELMSKYGTPSNVQFVEADKSEAKEKKVNAKSLIQLLVEKEMTRIDKLSTQNNK